MSTSGTSTESQVDTLSPVRPRIWLEFPAEDNREKIRCTRRGGGGFALEGLTEKEIEAFIGFLNGSSFVRVVNGRLHAWSTYDQLPDAVDDPLLTNHWSVTGETKKFGKPPGGEGWRLPGIIITAVGAGGGSGEPQRSYRILTNCGFICLRSKRLSDGTYWEQWVLHSVWGATGELSRHMKEWSGGNRQKSYAKDWFAEVEEAARFLAVDLRVAFGSLDITIQRWALPNSD